MPLIINIPQQQFVQYFITLTNYFLLKQDSFWSDRFHVRNFLHIPKTNFLIINTVFEFDKFSSIIYYKDMSEKQGEIINVIKPDFVILEMDYIPKLNKILVINIEKVIIADPYTLKTVSQFYNQYTKSGYMITNTDYAVILSNSNQIKIFDTISVQIVQTMDHNLYSYFQDWSQFFSKTYKLNCQDPLAIFVSTRNGIIVWDFSIDTKATKFHGYIEATKHEIDTYHNRFTKHPSEDIIFIGDFYYQITALKITRNEQGLVFEKLMQTKLYDAKYGDFIYFIEFAYKEVGSEKIPFLYCGDISYITEVQLDIDLSNNKVQVVNPSNPYYRYIPNTNDLYQIQGSTKFIISSNDYVTVYDFQDNSEFYYLQIIQDIQIQIDFFSDEYSKKLFTYSEDQLFIVAFKQTYMNFYLRQRLYKYYFQAENKFLKPIYRNYNNIFSIQNCFECILVKSRDNEDYVQTTNLQRDYNVAKQSSITQTLQLNWDLVGTYLDPFKLKDTIFFTVGFPNKAKIQPQIDGLFYLINAQDSSVYYRLKSPDQERNNRNTNFALVSLENESNLEIFGIDVLGTIYIWDLASENFDFKYYIEFNECKNSQIGAIFHYQQTKKIVLACEDFSIRTIDTLSKQGQNLKTLTSTPLVIRAFSSISIIAIGEKYLCETYIYKYNPVKDIFEMFLTITSGQIKSILIWIELLKDNTIWIQFRYSYIFYKLGDCINDNTLCTQCTQSPYFDTNNNYDKNGIYGKGTVEDPYTSSSNFMTAIIKAQYYKELIQGVSNMLVDINISPNNVMTLSKEIITFDFTSIISITFKSTENNNVARIQYYNQLALKNYNSITFKNIEIFYNIETDQDTCGLLITDVKNQVIIDNIQQHNIKNNTRGCQQIQIQNSFVQIKKYKISSESFADQQYLISTINSNKIIIENLIIDNCELGESFQILKQETNLEVGIKNLFLTNNYCVNNLSEDTLPQSLFSGGLFSVNSVYISGNIFCNKNIFTTITSQNHSNQIFEFNDIEVNNNKFYLQTTYVFFNCLYSMLSLPRHELIMKNIKFKENKLQNRFKNELITSSYVQTNKVAKLQFDTIYLENHYDIQFSFIEFASEITFNNFYCTNDDNYLKSMITDKVTSGCIQISESSKVTISKLIVDNRKAIDNSLLIIQNIMTKQSTLIINDSEFKNLILHQSQISTFANPIHVESSFQINFEMNNSHFVNNKLQNVEYSLTHSTTALWVQNYVGKVIIQNSSFVNCQSDSLYNFMFIQSDIIQLENIILQKSSFTTKLDKNKEKEQDKYLFKQEGGMINTKVNTLNLINSEFSQSTASIGSFLYIQSLSEILKMSIENTLFSEGYSSVDGGAFYIDAKGSQFQFDCVQCKFDNIYTLQNKGSSISFEQYNYMKTQDLNIISFVGGFIKNVQGILDNYFIQSQQSQTKFENIYEITSYEFNSDSDAYQHYFSKNNNQQATLMNLINSTATINNCSFYNLNMHNPQSTYPLLINSEKSSVLIKQSSVKDSVFFSSAIKLIGGKITFENSKFLNVNQYQQRRFLQQLIEVTPNSQANSLIIIENGQLQASKQSQFMDIVCSNNCNGGVFQVKNGKINLENIELINTKSTFGGCLFMQGIEENNVIKNVDFKNCKSEQNGGGIYIQSLQKNIFKFEISQSQFTNNISSKSKGGAIYIISEAQIPDNQIVNITNSHFISNTAQVGGAIYQQNISSNIYDSNFINNKGDLYGNDTLSYPSQLYLINEKKFLNDYNGQNVNGLLEIQNFRSGDQFQYLSFQLRNEKNEIIKPVTISELISPSTNETEKFNIRGNLTEYYNLESQSFEFKNLFIVGDPGSSVTIEFISDQIYVLNSKTNAFEQTYSFKIIINFRECISGEQILAYNSLKECEVCPEKKFSFGIQQCQDCPTGATCLGGANVVSIPGYWRKTQESSQFILCENYEENCKGGTFGNEICFEGHIGALCEECDIYGDKWRYSYSKADKYTCSRCDKIQYNLWVVVFVTIWTMITVSLAIKGDIDNSYQKITEMTFKKKLIKKYPITSQSISQSKIKEESFNRIRSKAKSLASSNSIMNTSKQKKKISNKLEKSGIYIKIFTNYMQIVSSITTFNLKIPSGKLFINLINIDLLLMIKGIFEFPQTIGSPLNQTMNSLDCALEKLNSDIPIIYLRLISSKTIILIYFFMSVIGVYLYSIIKKQKRFPWYVLSTVSMFLIIYVQPDLIDQIISLLSCRQIGDTNYILANVSYECYTNEHLKYIVFLLLPLLLIWVFILPIILFFKLKSNRNNLNSVQIKLKYGFLYKEYKDQAFYWEFVKIVEKLAIILFLNFYSQRIITKGILVFIIITFYGILSLIIEPYQESEINSLDVHSTNVCAITILLGLFIYNNAYPYFVYSSLGIIIIINAWFSFIVLRKIIERQYTRIKQFLKYNLGYLLKKIPLLQKCFKQEEQNQITNSVIKQKIKKLLEKYVEMKPLEKKQFLLKMVEAQFNMNYGVKFEVDSDNQKSVSQETQSKVLTEQKMCQLTIKNKKASKQQEYNQDVEEREYSENENYMNRMSISQKTELYRLRAHRISDIINFGETLNNQDLDSDKNFFVERLQAEILYPHQKQNDSLALTQSIKDPQNIIQGKQQTLTRSISDNYFDTESTKTEEKDLEMSRSIEQKIKNYGYRSSRVNLKQYF